MKSVVFAATLISGLGIQTAFAMPHCADRDEITASLTDRFSEAHVASGLQSESGLVEIWASDTDSTWTILMTRPDGQTCVMASGTHWLTVLPEIVPAGDPA